MVLCPNCSHECQDRELACHRCGQLLTIGCPECGGENPPASRFCNQCGASLKGGTRPAQAERRQLTVLFVDLVDSTTLAESLDPEVYRDLVRAFQAAVAAQVSRYDGHVAQYLGDGILIYFGYPRAHEDEPRRAVLAGLRILEAVEQMGAAAPAGVRPSVRLSAHTGPVVTGEVGAGSSREHLAVGPTPNIAARLQSFAEPGSLIVSSEIRTLAGDHFDWRPLGAKVLKGVSQAVEVYRVVGERSSAFAFVSSSRQTPLVDRRRELELLSTRFELAREGSGQCVLITGEAGLGKSRLVQSLLETIGGHDHTCLVGQCTSLDSSSALAPVIRLLQELLSLRPDDPTEVKLRKLESGLAGVDLRSGDLVPLIADLLSIPSSGAYAPLESTPRKRKEETLEALLGLTRKLCAEGPLVFIYEDLHWADPSTLELIELLASHCSSMPLLLLLTGRESFQLQWSDPHLGRLVLSPLSQEEVVEVARGVTRGKQLPPAILDQIVAKTDGVPLFVEELTSAVLDSGSLAESTDRYEGLGEGPQVVLPSTLLGSLTARLDCLGEAKTVAQLGAVIGREFSFDLLALVSEQDPESLGDALSRLLEAGLLYARGERPFVRYVFKHALIQETAYELLLKTRREEYHRRIAEAILDGFPYIASRQPEIVARHFTAAKCGERAVEYWLQAGRLALQKSANAEALHHFRQGLEQLEALPDPRQRAGLEVAFQMSIGTALTESHGYAAPQVEQAYRRAQELCELAGGSPQIFWVEAGLVVFRLVRGEVDEAQRMARQLLELAESEGHDALLSAASCVLGTVSFYQGEFNSALGWCDRAIELADLDDHTFREHAGCDVDTTAHTFAALSLWHLGFPDAALRRARVAQDTSRGHAYAEAFTLILARVELHYFRREWLPVLELSREVISSCDQRGFRLWRLQGILFQCWARVQARLEPAAAAGAPPMEEVLEALQQYRATGSCLALPMFLGLAAETLMAGGRLEAASELVDEALALVESGQNRWWEPELHRLRGELTLAIGRDDRSRRAEAEEALRTAVTASRSQGSSALQLRAALSWARAFGDGDSDGRESVAEVYQRFTEGFQTPDLQDARSFVQEAE